MSWGVVEGGMEGDRGMHHPELHATTLLLTAPDLPKDCKYTRASPHSASHQHPLVIRVASHLPTLPSPHPCLLPQHLNLPNDCKDRGLMNILSAHKPFTSQLIYPTPHLACLLPQHLNLPKDCKDGYSTSRTCEMSLSNHSGINFRGLVYLVDEATAPKKQQAAAAK